MNQPGDFESIEPPCASGVEFIRAAIDSSGMLAISLGAAPLLSDVRLWGIALADIAKSASQTHSIAEQMHSDSFDESCARPDNADALLALEMIRRQFIDELSFGYGDSPDATVDYPLQLPDAVPISDLSKGDRFVHERRWYIVVAFAGTYAVVVDLMTGDISEISLRIEAHPVRRSTCGALSTQHLPASADNEQGHTPMTPKIIVNPRDSYASLYYISASAKSLLLGDDFHDDDHVCGFVATPMTVPPHIVIAASSPSREAALDALGGALQTRCAEDPVLNETLRQDTRPVDEWRQEATQAARDASLRIATRIASKVDVDDPSFNFVMAEAGSYICDLLRMLGESEVTPSKVSIIKEILQGYLVADLEHWNEFIRTTSDERLAALRDELHAAAVSEAPGLSDANTDRPSAPFDESN